MMLGTKGRYAVMAMVDLAIHLQEVKLDVQTKNGNGVNHLGKSANHGNAGMSRKSVPLADIASRQDIALSYLEQLFSKLKNAGLVGANRGPGGGYFLLKPASEISALDVIKSAEEQIKMTRCNNNEMGCMNKKARCLTHDLWHGLTVHIENYLSSISIYDICSDKIDIATISNDVEQVNFLPVVDEVNGYANIVRNGENKDGSNDNVAPQ